jgi:hypothetical protein
MASHPQKPTAERQEDGPRWRIVRILMWYFHSIARQPPWKREYGILATLLL